MKMNCQKHFANYGEMLTRIVLGLIFVIAGYGKLFGAPGIQGFSGMLEGLGLPAAGFLAVLVGIIELVGGIMLLLGLFTTIPALLLAIVMLVAIFTVHLDQGWSGIRYPLLLFVLLIRYAGTPGFCPMKKFMKK